MGKLRTTTIILSTLFAACGGGGGSNTAPPDAGVADGQPVCSTDIPADFGTLPSDDTNTLVYDDPTNQVFEGDVYLTNEGTTNAPLADEVSIQLYGGFAPFDSGNVVPGTYPLTGDQTGYGTCGACVLVYDDYDLNCSGGDCAARYYMPTAGSMTVASVAGRFTVSLSNVVFQQVDIDYNHTDSSGNHDYPTTPTPMGCGTGVDSLAVDLQYADTPDGGVGSFDAGTPDSGTPDAGTPDAFVADAFVADAAPITLTLNKAGAVIDTPLGIMGTGFQAGETVNLTVAGQPVAAATADGSGAFATTPNVPSATSVGPSSVVGTGATSGRTASANVTILRQCGTGTDKCIFLTSTTSNGNLAGLAGGDSTCAARATAAGLTGSFKAWLGTTTMTANGRMTAATVPYVRLDGQEIAANYTGLTNGTLEATINVTETGAAPAAAAWTGAGSDGTSGSADCNVWADGTTGNNGTQGSTGSTTVTWSNKGDDTCDLAKALYCVEQ